MSEDTIVWTDDFNPLEFALGLVQFAHSSKNKRASREFLFDQSLSKEQLFYFQIVWAYFGKMMNKQKNTFMIWLDKTDTKLIAKCDLNGLPDDEKPV